MKKCNTTFVTRDDDFSRMEQWRQQQHLLRTSALQQTEGFHQQRKKDIRERKNNCATRKTTPKKNGHIFGFI